MQPVQVAGRTYGSAHQPDPRPLASNGFEVALPDQVDVVVRDLPRPSEVKEERTRLRGYWFVHWFDGKLFQLRLKPGGPNVDGEHKSIRTADHPWLLRARLDDALEEALPKYGAIKKRPFTFLAQKVELVVAAAEAAGLSHKLLNGFKVIPRFALSPKISEPIDGATRVGVFVTIGMRYDIEVGLSDLLQAGIDLRGMYAVRRNRQPGERGLLGRVRSIESDRVELFEETDQTSANISDVKLEGSKENFTRCLTALLGYNYKKLLNALDDQEAGYRTGPRFDDAVRKMGEFLAKSQSGLQMASTLRLDSTKVDIPPWSQICPPAVRPGSFGCAAAASNSASRSAGLPQPERHHTVNPQQLVVQIPPQLCPARCSYP